MISIVALWKKFGKKVNYIEEYGPIDLLGSLNPGMSLIPTVKKSLSLFKRILLKLGILVEIKE